MAGFVDAAATLVGAGLNYYGAQKANKMNRDLAREQMGFQERMSNTSYQRARADMEAAGINPMLAFSQGGASSPGGSSATMQNEMSGVVSSAIEVKRAQAELKNLQEQNKNLQAQNRKINAETTLTEIASMLEKSKISKAQLSELYDKSKFGHLKEVTDRAGPAVSGGVSILKKILMRGL